MYPCCILHKINAKYVAYGMDRSSLNCLQYGHMEFKLYTVWKSFYMINPVSLRCWQYGPDGMYGQNCAQNCSDNCNNNTCHVVSGLCVYGCRKGWMGPYCQQRKLTGMDPSNLNCLPYEHIELTLFMIWTHQTYVVYRMDPSSLNCLQHGHIKLMLFTIQSLMCQYCKQHKFDVSIL
jgi:hypothetical protein